VSERDHLRQGYGGPPKRHAKAAESRPCARSRNEAGEFSFEKDDRTNKKTAREMTVLTRNINAQAFNGQPEVTCATFGGPGDSAIPRPASYRAGCCGSGPGS